MMAQRLNPDEFKRIGREVMSSTRPKPYGRLSVSITFKDGMPMYLQAGDPVSGANKDGYFDGFFDGSVSYDGVKGWALQIVTEDKRKFLMYIGEVKQFRIYE
jgi:hypothetical protein